MPQASYEYAVGRISQLSTKMLDAAKLRRIYEAGSFQEALALLLETGYGGNLSPEQLATEEIDYVIREQLQISRRIVWEVTPAPELTSLFLLEVDGHNLKTLLKARLLGVEAPDVLIDGGSFPLEQLKECVATSNYEPLPKVYTRPQLRPGLLLPAGRLPERPQRSEGKAPQLGRGQAASHAPGRRGN